MAWTAPSTPYFSTGQVVNATVMNVLSDNLRYLKGTDGPTVLEDQVIIPPTASGNGKGLRFGDGTTQYANLQGMNLSSNSYVFFGTNRQFDGSAWQQLTTRAGGVVQITQDELAYYTFPASSSTPTERFRIKNTGNVGIGTSAPQGKLHITGSVGNVVYLEATGVGASAVTLLPTSSFTKYILLLGSWKDDVNSLVNTIATTTSTPGSVVAFGSGGNTGQFGTTSGGLTVQRTAGTGTYTVALIAIYV